MNKINKNSLLEKLNSDEFNVTQNKGTEAPFTGKYLNNKQTGCYKCICCNTELFLSKHKYDSHSGFGPSLKTCPKWALQLLHTTSVRVIPCELSIIANTFLSSLTS